MTLINTLILLLAVQFALFGAAWGMGAWLLGLPRLPALHWMGSSWLIATGCLLFLGEDWLPWALVLPARNLALLMGVMMIRRGAAIFMRRDPSNLEQGLVLGVAAGGLLLIGNAPEVQWVRTAMMATAIGWVLVRAGTEQIDTVGDEFGRLTGWILGLPPVLLGVAFLARATMALVVLPDSPMLNVRFNGQWNVALLVTLLLASTLLQFSLLYIVILRMVRKLHRLSSQDALTHLLNRRAWNRALQAEALRLRRSPQSTAMLVVDLDHFKAINDRHGHPAGDAVLVTLAGLLKEGTRGTDLVARYGGEEFALLLTEIRQRDDALHVAEKIRAAVADRGFDGGVGRVTVSVGVAWVEPEDVSPAAALQRADAALYRAKAEGRDRCVAAWDPTAPSA